MTVGGRLLCASGAGIPSPTVLALFGFGRSPAEEQVDGSRFKEMIIDLVVIRHRSNDMRANVFLVVESLQLAPHSAIPVFDQLWLRVTPIAHLICRRHLGIVPLLDFDGTGAVIHLVGDVGRLSADVPNLANESDLSNWMSMT